MLHRRTAPVALLTCLAVLAAAPSAGAAKSHPTKVVVSIKLPAFHGSLKSSDDGCLAGRAVTMYRKKGGRARKLGSGTSNATGKWKVPVGKNLPSGEYFATVAAKGECKAGRSKPLPIG
ncbi:MAG TPA: hypothetical protein VGG40_03955 [Solirubrobacterales bacterium]|jgi:hypothetical protein